MSDNFRSLADGFAFEDWSRSERLSLDEDTLIAGSPGSLSFTSEFAGSFRVAEAARTAADTEHYATDLTTFLAGSLGGFDLSQLGSVPGAADNIPLDPTLAPPLPQAAQTGNGAVSLTATGTAFTQDFNTLAISGATNTALPTGWYFLESGGGARDNGQYDAGTGSSNTADTYSFGSAAGTDRALGQLRSGTLASIIGSQFTNNTGAAIGSLDVSYIGEQWRLGTSGHTDSMTFQISFDATSLTTGTWTTVTQLNFTAPISVGTVGALDGNLAANRVAVTHSLTLAQAIASGQSFWIRWQDTDATGSDDGLGIDNFSITPQAAAVNNGALAINDVSLSEGNSGTTNFTFTVTRSGGSTGAVSATWTLADGTSDSADFTTTPQTGIVSFADGETSRTFTITVAGDTAIEGNETFFVNLTAPTGGATITDGQGQGTIVNDDVPPVGTLAIDDVSVTEGNSGTTNYTFTVTRSGGSSGAVSADWALGLTGTALADDFTTTPQTGTVNFADGQTSVTISIAVAGDTTFEGDDTFFVNLTNPTGGATITDAQGLGTITNDDAAPPVGTLSIDDVAVTEGNSGTTNLTFTVTRASGSAGSVGATWTLTNGTTNAADFGTSTFTGTVSFTDGQTSATIVIAVAGDTTFEPNETFTVTLSAPIGGVTIADASGSGTITNDDATPAVANVWINEFHYDNAGTDVNEFVEIAGLAGVDLTGWSLVLYNGNGGASYSTLNLSGTLANSSNGFGFVKVLTPGIQNGAPDGFALVDNFGRVVQFLSYEGTMTATNGPASGLTSTDVGVEQASAAIGFTLQLQGAGSSYSDFTWAANVANTEGAVNAGQSFLSGTDQGQLRIADARVTEGNSGTANLTFTVSRAGGFASAATVDFQILLTGTANAADLDAAAVLSGTLTFAAGEFTRTITVPVLGDMVGEDNETLTVQLSNVTGNAVIADGTAIGTITNDDPLSLTIMAIQGAGHTSAYVGQPVTTTGIVTAVDTNGFYLQDPTGDGNAATSDGIFVFTGTAPAVAVGDGVSVSASVSEFAASGGLSLTQLNPTSVTVNSTGNALPAAVLIGTGGLLPPNSVIDNDGLGTYDPATDGIDFWESLEGMRVTIDNPQVVSNTNSFGETDVVASLGAGATGVNARGGITIGSGGDYNPEKLQIDDRFGALIGYTPNHSIGDQLGSVTGVLNYSFLNYEVLVTSAVTVTRDVTLTDETTALVGDVNFLTIATYNVENMDPSDNKYTILGNDIVYSLRAPDIVALQEVQDADGAGTGTNLSGASNVQGLIDAIFALSGIVYTYIEIAPTVANSTGGEPNGNIRNGYLYQADRVALVSGSVSLLTDAAFNGSRKPLVATWLFQGTEVTTINVHFTSRGGSDAQWGATQPPAAAGDAARTAQAATVGAYVNNNLATDPNHQYMILGDWNGFYFETAQTQLTSGGVFTNLAVSLLPGEERYSYVFEGNSQLIDNLLVTGGLLTGAQIDAVHLNAEFSGSRPTDHDPQIARLLLGPAPTTFALSNSSVAENLPAGTVVGTLSATDPGDTLTYSLTNDASGLFMVNPTTGEITTTAPLNFEALASYSIIGRVVDSSGRAATQSFTISVGDVNEAPTANADAVNVNEDATSANLWSTLLSNDTDPDAGTTLTITAINATGTRGTVIFDAATQSLRYVADNNAFDELEAGENLTDSFTYTISDGTFTRTATATVTVDGINDVIVTTPGTSGPDTINGGDGEDELFGLAGVDILNGGKGHDWLVGGTQNDTLTGGEGRDTFVFNQGDKHDFITDFSKTDDRLVIGGGGVIGKATAFDFNNDGILDLRIKIFWNGVLGASATLLGVDSIAGVRIDYITTPTPPSQSGGWVDWSQPPPAQDVITEKFGDFSVSDGDNKPVFANLADAAPIDYLMLV